MNANMELCTNMMEILSHCSFVLVTLTMKCQLFYLSREFTVIPLIV